MLDVMELDAATSGAHDLEDGWAAQFEGEAAERGIFRDFNQASRRTYGQGRFRQRPSRPTLASLEENDDLMVSILDRQSGRGYAPSGKPAFAKRHRDLRFWLQHPGVMRVLVPEMEVLPSQGPVTLSHLCSIAETVGVDQVPARNADDVADTSNEVDGTHNDRTDIPDQVEGIIEFLKSSGLVSISNRLGDLHREISEDPDEFPVSAGSLGKFTDFVLDNPLPGSPSVWVDTYGYVGLEWRIPDPDRSEGLSASETACRDDDHLWGKGDGILAMVFSPSGLVKFSGTSGPVGQSLERLTIRGTFPQTAVMSAVQPFLSRLVAQ